jgi:3-hydroxy-9,10-secoandrosta-1,3,5(10)-triene-9,17-dione monooxygenase
VADSIPTSRELTARARGLIPVLKSRAAQADADRRLPRATMQDFHEAGFFKILQPARWGGYEMHPQAFYDVQMALAEGCMSSSWVFGVVGVHNFHLALFDLRAQQDVWREDPTVLIASTYMPGGKAERAPGGFNFSGRWSFSSGCQLCDWILLGGIVPPAKEGGPMDVRSFLLPKSDFKIIENWDTLGLKGTGSHDIVVDKAFVPDYRTHRLMDGFLGTNPGGDSNPGALYKFPFAQVFIRAVSTSSLGAARGALQAFLETSKTRFSVNTGKFTKDDPTARLLAAEAHGEIEEMDATLSHVFETMAADVRAGTEISIQDRLRYRYHSATVARRCATLVDRLLLGLGAKGVFMQNPVMRFWCDLQTARAHLGNDPKLPGGKLGDVLFGESTDEVYI